MHSGFNEPGRSNLTIYRTPNDRKIRTSELQKLNDADVGIAIHALNGRNGINGNNDINEINVM